MPTPTRPLRPGTRIELNPTPAFLGFPGVAPERAVIQRWREKLNGPQAPGWHVIQFADGGRLQAHESRFRVIGNH